MARWLAERAQLIRFVGFLEDRDQVGDPTESLWEASPA